MEELKTWKKTNNYYNREVVTCDVWSYKVNSYMTIYLQDKPNYTFTVSAGANSDSSYTGSFYGHSEVTTLIQAMEGIKKKHPNYFK